MIKGKIKNEDSVYTYELNVAEEELIACYARDWILEWCRKYHPEAFEEAEKHVKELIKNENN